MGRTLRPGKILLLLLLIVLAGCAHRGVRPEVVAPGAVEKGYASWYGKPFHGRRTASGEIYNMYDLTAAHKTLPFGTRVRVTRRDTGSSVVVRINDRGPFVRRRIIDLSFAAAKKIGLDVDGVAPVRLRVLGGGRVARAPAPKPLPAPPRPSPEAIGAQCWWVQVGAFRDLDNALRARELLRRDGESAVSMEAPGGFHRVRVGPYPRRHTAEKALKRLRKSWPPAQVVSCGR